MLCGFPIDEWKQGVLCCLGRNVFASLQERALCPQSGTTRRLCDKEALEKQLGRSPCVHDTGSPSGL